MCRLALVALLYVLAGLPGLSRIRANPDIWWHLRTGQWIVSHGSVPTTDPFSSHGSDSAWVAYSWLFDLLVSGLHAALGLQGIALHRSRLSWHRPGPPTFGSSAMDCRSDSNLPSRPRAW